MSSSARGVPPLRGSATTTKEDVVNYKQFSEERSRDEKHRSNPDQGA
jgi:hypothetical protein